MADPGIWRVREEAAPLAAHLAATLGGHSYPAPAAPSNREAFRQLFHRHRAWILLMTTGIAVRYLDGLPQHKLTDPAVVTLDEAGRFAVSLLSGHEGGANELAYRVAAVTGAVPVVTTATEALKPLVLGLGCRRGVTPAQVDAAAGAALAAVSRHLTEVREIATIDLKRHEDGLLTWCRQHDLPLRIIARADIRHRPWQHEASAWVEQRAGVAGVCEPAALIAAPRGGLLLEKFNHDSVSVAIVEDPLWSGWSACL